MPISYFCSLSIVILADLDPQIFKLFLVCSSFFPLSFIKFTSLSFSSERIMEEEEESKMDDLQGEQRSLQYCSARMVSPEIVEIGEESRSLDHQHHHHTNDVYVAVGKDDLGVVKWALDHHVVSVSPSARVFLVHIFPPTSYIPTPVGRLSRSQLSQEQVRVYINEESNRRRSLLQKYIRLCADAKVSVETMLIEHDKITKAIIDLIPVVNITRLVIGTKHSPDARRLTKKLTKGEYVKRHAPDYCEVIIVYNGKKVSASERAKELNHPFKGSSSPGKRVIHHIERKFFECACFSALCGPKLKEIRECVGIREEHQKSTVKHK